MENEPEKVLYMEDIGDIACDICKSADNDDNIIICDKCGTAYHCQYLNIEQSA